jgi:hypothetical protein
VEAPFVGFAATSPKGGGTGWRFYAEFGADAGDVGLDVVATNKTRTLELVTVKAFRP